MRLARVLVVAFGLVPFGVVFACEENIPPPPPNSGLWGGNDGAPLNTDVDGAALLPPGPSFDSPDAATAGYLPSGDYEVTTEVKADTCSKDDGGAGAGTVPEVAVVFVQMKVSKDKMTGKNRVAGNFVLPVPHAKGFTGARSDITLDPPAAPTPHVIHGVGSQCPAYETKTNYLVMPRTGGGAISIEYKREFGDASTCPAKLSPPSKCTLDYVYTYKLVKKLCDAECNVSFSVKPGSDAGANIKCACPDGGAP